MSGQPMTDAEAAALGKVEDQATGDRVLAAYRAGYNDGYGIGHEDGANCVYVVAADNVVELVRDAVDRSTSLTGDAVDELAAELVEAFRARPDLVRELYVPRVFREGDPEPTGPVALLDDDGGVETWDPAANHADVPWPAYLDTYGALVEVPDYRAALEADERRRAAS